MSSKDTSLKVVLAGKKKIDVEIAGHVVHTDQPVENDGENTAPSPFQLFLASMGACAGIFVQGFLSKRNIPVEGVFLTQSMVYDDEGSLKEVHVTLHLTPDVPEKYHPALIKVMEQCTVKKAIVGQPQFFVGVDFQR